jgi:predicted SAM-dependent methyltransferase
MKTTTKLALRLMPTYVWVAARKELFIKKCNRQIRSTDNRKKIMAAKQSTELNIHLGCGKRIFKNWLNIDVYKAQGIDIQLNFTNPLPFDTGSVNMIYSEHVLEHLFKPDAENLLKECCRILKNGGTIRIGVPDAEIYFTKYKEKDTHFFEKLKHLGGATQTLDTPIDIINQMFRMGGDHLFAWDYDTLQKALQKAGFSHIKKYESGVASTADICLDDSEHAFETLYVEAIKN